MPVLSRTAIVALFMHLVGMFGIHGVMAATATPQANAGTSVVASMSSPTPTSFVPSATSTATTTSVSDCTNWSTAAPAATAAPVFNDEIVAAAITIPIPVISIQTWSINPSLHISEDFDHEHDTSKVTKEESSWSMGGNKVVPAGGDPWKAAPGADTKGSSIKVATGPDANGFVPPVYNGPLHGNELPNFIATEDTDVIVRRAEAAEGEEPSGWKIIKDLYGPKDPQTVSTGELGHPAPQRPSYKGIDRSEDSSIPSVFGGDEDGHIDAKKINPVSGSSSVTTKDGYKVSEGDSVVETKTHGDTETASYTGLGVAEYNKVKSILDYFHHGKKPLTLAAAMEVAAVNETGTDTQPSFEEAPFEQLNKTTSKLVPRFHGKDSKTETSLRIVKHMMEEPAAQRNPLKKVLEVVYGELNKTMSIESREIVKHMLDAPVPVPSTLLTVARSKTLDDVPEATPAPTPTSVDEFYPIEDYYHRNMKRGGEEGITFTLHAHAATKTYATAWATATEDHSSHTETFPHDDDGAHYEKSKKKSDWDIDNLEDSEVFDDPKEDHETNIEAHDDLRDLQDESKDMSQEIDDEFQDEFGSN